MRDLMRKTNLVMMAEPEESVETEKEKNLVRYEITINAMVGLSSDTLWTEIRNCEFHRAI
jgi:hypothetical protein